MAVCQQFKDLLTEMPQMIHKRNAKANHYYIIQKNSTILGSLREY